MNIISSANRPDRTRMSILQDDGHVLVDVPGQPSAEMVIDPDEHSTNVEHVEEECQESEAVH